MRAAASQGGRGESASLRPVQARAQATREALLVAGRTLLVEREWDAIAIADIAGAAGMSVGSFYGRFHDKEAFFDELQQQVTQSWRAQAVEMLAHVTQTQAPPEQVVARACALTVQMMRSDSGFLRSALKHASTHPTSWTPIKQVGQDVVNELAECLGPLLPHLPSNQRAARIGFAMQLVYGTCLNAVLHDPGPLALNSPCLARELARVMNLYLGLAPSPRATSRSSTKRKP